MQACAPPALFARCLRTSAPRASSAWSAARLVARRAEQLRGLQTASASSRIPDFAFAFEYVSQEAHGAKHVASGELGGMRRNNTRQLSVSELPRFSAWHLYVPPHRNHAHCNTSGSQGFSGS